MNSCTTCIILNITTGDEVTRAFTNSFVHNKVIEIQNQMKECLQCYCKADGPICEPATGGTNSSFCIRIPGMRLIPVVVYVIV